MSKFQPGISGNPNGRRKGSQNKISASLKETLATFTERKLDEELEILWQDFSARDKLDFFKTALPFLIPKLSTQTVKDDTEENPRKAPPIAWITSDDEDP